MELSAKKEGISFAFLLINFRNNTVQKMISQRFQEMGTSQRSSTDPTGVALLTRERAHDRSLNLIALLTMPIKVGLERLVYDNNQLIVCCRGPSPEFHLIMRRLSRAPSNKQDLRTEFSSYVVCGYIRIFRVYKGLDRFTSPPSPAQHCSTLSNTLWSVCFQERVRYMGMRKGGRMPRKEKGRARAGRGIRESSVREPAHRALSSTIGNDVPAQSKLAELLSTFHDIYRSLLAGYLLRRVIHQEQDPSKRVPMKIAAISTFLTLFSPIGTHLLAVVTNASRSFKISGILAFTHPTFRDTRLREDYDSRDIEFWARSVPGASVPHPFAWRRLQLHSPSISRVKLCTVRVGGPSPHFRVRGRPLSPLGSSRFALALLGLVRFFPLTAESVRNELQYDPNYKSTGGESHKNHHFQESAQNAH
ncbi:hypothetical protein SDJN02_00753, partial [Cucurbita argyrosperma subsp. argyrosperma]